MLKTLRNRLILSHILPLLIIIPLMGIGLIYVLETQVYLPALTRELENDARLMARLVALEEDGWQSPAMAQALLNRKGTQSDGQVKLLDAQGRLLASSDPADQGQIGQALAPDLSDFKQPTPGDIIRQVHYSPPQAAEIIEVIIPVNSRDGQVLGFVWISYPFSTFADEVYQLRFLIVSLLALGLLLGSGIGYLLAISVSTPVRQVTYAISALAHNSQMTLLTPYGPEEIQSLAQSVNELVTRLRELEQARRQLLANLVHELGRPLGALRSAITALGRGAEKDQALYNDLLTGMDNEAERLQRLLNDLAGLHEHVLGTLELDRHAITLTTWLPDCLYTWQNTAIEKGLQWQWSFADGASTVFADPNRLAQVVGNLASNAVKFTPTGGAITITTRSQPGQMGITFEDTGPGMTPEEQAKIFEPFYRGAHGRRFPQGMGLGLSIARELTQAHGGQLVVESSPGAGSRFTVWLPTDMPPI